MRPLRALLGLAILIGLWLWWRTPAVRRELAHLAAAAHLAEARGRLAPHQAAIVTEMRHGIPDEYFPEIAIAVDTATPKAVGSSRAVNRQRTNAPAAETKAIAAIAPNPDTAAQEARLPAEAVVAAADDATTAYRLLSEGNRRESATLFRSALAVSPNEPRAAGWRRQLAALERRWSGSAYVLARASGTGGLSAAPLLGGGQSGAQIVYSLDPLARRPVAIEGRVSAPNGEIQDGAQAALGVTWQFRPALSVTAERLVSVGAHSRGGWTVRAAGGAATARLVTARHWLDASIYAETGIVGLRDPAYYGAIQGRIGQGAALTQTVTASAGVGGWASVQRDVLTVSRVEVGPTLRLRAGALELAVDYRLRIAGNAAPGSGPALTVSTVF